MNDYSNKKFCADCGEPTEGKEDDKPLSHKGRTPLCEYCYKGYKDEARTQR